MHSVFRFAIEVCVPRLRLNAPLFHELIREDERGRKCYENHDPPEVRFVGGPPDGVLGSYSGNVIMVDVLEIFLVAIAKNPLNPNVGEAFKRELVRVLAHEGGHWHYERKRGKLIEFEHKLLNTFFTLLGVLATYVIVAVFVRLVMHGVLPDAFAVHWSLGVIAMISAVLLFWFLVAHLLARFFIFWRTLSKRVIYQVSSTERFARQFEKRAKNDKRWEDVVSVEH